MGSADKRAFLVILREYNLLTSSPAYVDTVANPRRDRKRIKHQGEYPEPPPYARLGGALRFQDSRANCQSAMPTSE